MDPISSLSREHRAQSSQLAMTLSCPPLYLSCSLPHSLSPPVTTIVLLPNSQTSFKEECKAHSLKGKKKKAQSPSSQNRIGFNFQLKQLYESQSLASRWRGQGWESAVTGTLSVALQTPVFSPMEWGGRRH